MKTAHEIATEAAKLVGGDRAQQHGDKGANFNATAVLWNAYLSIRKGGAAAPITGSDFANMMVLAKMSRIHTGAIFNMDNFVDMAGYSACGGEVALQEQTDPAAETITWTPWGGRSKLSPVPDNTLVEWWNDRRLPEQKWAGEIDWSAVFEYRVIESEWFNHDGTPFMPMILNDMTDIFIEYKTHNHRVHAIHARWSEVVRWRYA